MEEDKIKRGPGQPSKFEQITLQEIIDIMLKFSAKGMFFQQLPAYIYKETDVMVSLSWLEKIKDPEFLRAKNVAFAACSDYWTDQMHQAAIPAAVFIFIQKNVAGWRDMKDIKLDADVKNTEDPKQKQERLDKIKSLVKEIS